MSDSVKLLMSCEDLQYETIEISVKEEMISKEDESREEFIPDSSLNQILSDGDDIEIKYEEVGHGFNNNTSTSEAEDDSEPETVSSFQHVDCSSVKATEEDLSEMYVDILKCEAGCETCLKYMKILSEHVRATHAPPQAIQDPLDIDPLSIPSFSPDVDQSSSVQVKCEVDEDSYKMEYSEEETKSSESDQDIESDTVSERGIDNSSSPRLTPNVHKRSQPGEKPYKDDEYENSVTESKYLTEHKKIHTGENPSRVKLTEHKRIHTGKKSFRCNKCEMNFTNKSHLTRHNKRFHTGEKGACSQSSSSTTKKRWRRRKKPNVYSCEMCGRAFSCQSRLTDHMRSHTGEKPFKCDECDKSFSLRGGLKIHKTIHTGERPWKCDGCERSFTSWKHLTEHKRIHKRLGKIFNCDLCMKSFKKQCALTLHMKIHNWYLLGLGCVTQESE